MSNLVKGVILDESELLSASEHGTPTNANDSSFQLRPGASYLLRKLRHSSIRSVLSSSVCYCCLNFLYIVIIMSGI